MIANTAQRPSWRVWPSVASLAHSVSGASTVILASCRRLERLRTCGVGASSPAPLVRRNTRLPEVWMPRSASRARILRWPSPTNGDSAISLADRRQELAIGHRADRPRSTAKQSMGTPGRCVGGVARTLPTWRAPRPARPGPTPSSSRLTDVQRLGRRGRRSISSLSALRMSRSIESSPTLRCASTSRRSSSGRGLLFQALAAGGQELLTPAADRAGRHAVLARQRVQGLAAQQAQHHRLLAARAPAHLPAALRATVPARRSATPRCRPSPPP